MIVTPNLIAQFSNGASQIIQNGRTGQIAIAEAMNELWSEVLGGGLYAVITQLGVFFAVGSLVLFMTQWAKALIEYDEPIMWSEIIWPLLVAVLLANDGAILANGTHGLRSVINNTSNSLLQNTSARISLQESYQIVTENIGAKAVIDSLVSQCDSIVDVQQQVDCLTNAEQQAQDFSRTLKPSSQALLAQIGSLLNPLNVTERVGFALQTAVTGWLMSIGMAFQWVAEVSMLLTGLLGPLAVGATLLPVGAKAIYAWLISFFSIGLVKISYNIIVGLVATLIVNAESYNPLVFAFVAGLIAPILALVLAAGGGLAIFNSLNSFSAFVLGGLK